MVLNYNYIVLRIQVKFKLKFNENICHFHSTIIVKGRYGWCGYWIVNNETFDSNVLI